jgi:hypothetical protein
MRGTARMFSTAHPKCAEIIPLRRHLRSPDNQHELTPVTKPSYCNWSYGTIIVLDLRGEIMWQHARSESQTLELYFVSIFKNGSSHKLNFMWKKFVSQPVSVSGYLNLRDCMGPLEGWLYFLFYVKYIFTWIFIILWPHFRDTASSPPPQSQMTFYCVHENLKPVKVKLSL